MQTIDIITFLEVFLIGEVAVVLSVEVGVGGCDWLVVEAEAEFPTPQGVCSGKELDNGILLLPPPPGDNIGGKLFDVLLLVLMKVVLLLYCIWKLASS